MSCGQSKQRCHFCKEFHHVAVSCVQHQLGEPSMSSRFVNSVSVEKKKGEPRKLAEDHWIYTGKVLELTESIPEKLMPIVEYLYVEAMVHGYKHALEDFEK